VFCRGEEDGCREGGGKRWYFFLKFIHLFNNVVRSFVRLHVVYVEGTELYTLIFFFLIYFIDIYIFFHGF